MFAEKYNEVCCDIVFGGSFFYAYADLSKFGLTFETASVKDIITVSMAVTEAVRSSSKPCHPEMEEITYVSGTILHENSLTESVNDPIKFMLVYGERHVSLLSCNMFDPTVKSLGNLTLLHRLKRFCYVMSSLITIF